MCKNAFWYGQIKIKVLKPKEASYSFTVFTVALFYYASPAAQLNTDEQHKERELCTKKTETLENEEDSRTNYSDH